MKPGQELAWIFFIFIKFRLIISSVSIKLYCLQTRLIVIDGTKYDRAVDKYKIRSYAIDYET